MRITETKLRKIIRRTIQESMYSQWKKKEDEKLAKHLSKKKQKTPDDVIDQVIQGLEDGTIDDQLTPEQIATVFCNRARLDSAKFYVADAIQQYMLGR